MRRLYTTKGGLSVYRYKQFLGIYFSLLIILTPVVFSIELTITDISGKENIRNYYRPFERIHINASARIETDNFITPDQFRIYIDGLRSDSFDGSSSTPCPGDPATCTYSRIAPSAGSHAYQIRLYDDTNKFNEEATPLITKTEPLISDIIPAEIRNLSVTSLTQNTRVSIQANAIDLAFSNSNTTTCSGISLIRFHLDDITTTPFKIIIGNNQCNQPINFEQTFPTLTDGTHTILAQAVDRFNQTGTINTANFMMDASAPIINDTGLIIRRSGSGEIINFIKTENDIRADISIPITDPNLQITSIRADFSSLSPGIGEIPATQYSNGFATWQDIPLINIAGCLITIKASDTLGNQGAKTITCNIRLDNTGPELIEISSGFRDASGTLLLATQSQINATFKEEGAGLNKNLTFLDLGDITGNSLTPTNGCVKTTSTWICNWKIQATRSSGQKQIGINPISTDDLGNKVIPKPRTTAILDTTKPLIRNFSMRIIPGADPGLNIPVEGATLELNINATDFTTAQIDLSTIGGSNQTQLSCTTTSCTTTTQIITSGPYRANITATLIDTAGNSAQSSILFYVIGIKNQNPNFWNANPTCSPRLIDRSTSILIEQQIFCDANLRSTNPNTKPIFINFPGPNSCTGDTASISDISALNLLTGSTHPTFDITLHATEFRTDSLTITCPILIVSTVNESGQLFLNPNPETENITMTLKFYNQPLGDAFKNIDRKVDEAVKDAKDNLKLVGQLETFLDYASKACNLIQIYNTIKAAYDSLIILFGNVERATGSNLTPAGAKAKAIKDKLCGISTATDQKTYGDQSGFGGLFHQLTKLCAFVNCRMEESDDGYLAKFGGGAAHCKLLKDKLASIGGVNKVIGPQGQPRGIAALDEQKYTYLGGNYNTLNVKENLILSTLCLCVPGIIHNINKYREINCNYGLCMKRDVKEHGLPISYCQNLKTYQTCNFIVGDVFNLFPIVRLWDTVLTIVKNIYANPFELLSVYSGLKCKGMCTTAFPEQYAACVYPKTLAKIGDAIQSIKAIKNIANFNKRGDACEQLQDLTKDKKEVKPYGT